MPKKIYVPMRQTDWQSYLCRMNDELASVFVDVAMSRSPPLQTNQKLAWLWIRLNYPRDDGLSSDNEFESLNRLENELQGIFGDDEKCRYVGRITTKGRREFYFYCDENFDFESVARDLLSKNSTFSFQIGEKSDASWNHYFHTLFPANEDWPTHNDLN